MFGSRLVPAETSAELPELLQLLTLDSSSCSATGARSPGGFGPGSRAINLGQRPRLAARIVVECPARGLVGGGGVGAVTEQLKEPTFILLLLLVNAMEGVI